MLANSFCYAGIPQVIINQPRLTVHKGNTVSFNCSAFLHYNFTEWYHSRWRSNQTVIENNTNHHIYQDATTSILTVSKVGCADEGIYTCSVATLVGSLFASSNLTVFGK